MKFYATAEGGFWSLSRKRFCDLLRDYTRPGCGPITSYGRELRRPPKGVRGCRKYSSKDCWVYSSDVVLVKLYDQGDIEDKRSQFCVE